MNTITHNLDQDYLQSLTQEERLRQMSEWMPAEWKQYHCPNGTMTIEEFRDSIYKRVDEIIFQKYGPEYLDDPRASSKS